MKQILLTLLGLSAFISADFTRSTGIVTDTQTTLQWQDDYSDNAGEIKTATWTAAIDYCEELGLDGGRWRLPNKNELLSLVDYTKANPSIDTAFTNTVSDYYWSSTAGALITSNAWLVYFSHGYTHYDTKSRTYHVRCVR